MKKKLIGLTIILCLVLMVSVSVFSQEKRINVGAKDFTEQYILGHIFWKKMGLMST